ncbi:MAG: hypothetical protein HYZ27_01480 [Deltaproteobacteria bacterium]|nr:hypothetical protein [Deltaproteobacteria bacterium]
MTLAIFEVTRHELLTLIKTKRALAIAIMYLTCALIAGLAIILVVRFIEKEALARLIQEGADPLSAAGTLSLMSEPAYQRLAGFFAGARPDEVAASLRQSVVLPFFLWGSLAFLPFLILLASFDVMAADLQSRSILYTVLRAPRVAILSGKVIAHSALFVTVTALGSLALALLAGALLESFSLTTAALGIVRIWLTLLPFGLCYLAISSFASVLVGQPFGALLVSFALVMGLRVVGWFRYVSEESLIAFMRHLEWVSPVTYHKGLWLAGVSGPLTSSGAYLGFAALFFALAAWRLRSRDL